MTMRRVIIESPYAGNVPVNKAYLQLCIRWCLQNNTAPFASHQMYTEALDDRKRHERLLGIDAGYEWWDVAHYVFFFTDLGMSPGMWKAYERCQQILKPYRYIHLKEQYDAPAGLDDIISRLRGDPQPGS